MNVQTASGSIDVRTCTHTQCGEVSFHVGEDMLIFIVLGGMNIRYGKVEYTACKDQMIFLKRDTEVNYRTFDGPDAPGKVEFIIFSLRYELVKEFVKIADLSLTFKGGNFPVAVNSIDIRMINYIGSLTTCFSGTAKPEANLVKIKLLELLFYVAGSNRDILVEILDLRDRFRSNIRATVEENIMNALSLNELAVLCGRSLSSFRRDFLALYNMPPSKWIREKRLEKASEFLQSTNMTVTDICYTLGFESIAHFSRLFKAHFGYPPTAFREKPMDQLARFRSK